MVSTATPSNTSADASHKLPSRSDTSRTTVSGKTADQMRNAFRTGQRIPLHRALRRLSPAQSDVLSMLGIPLLAMCLLQFFWSDICLFFMGAFYFFLSPLISPLSFGTHAIAGLDSPLFIPRIASTPPDALQWWTGYALCAGLLILAALPLKKLIPLRHFAGFTGVVQLVAQLYSAFGDGLNTIHAQDYLVDAIQLSVYWIWFTPWLLAFTFNLFPFQTLHKMRLTALAVCYQVLLLPVQYALHAWILHAGSGLWAAPLFFTSGLPFNVLTTLCLYGIGLSWPGVERDED